MKQTPASRRRELARRALAGLGPVLEGSLCPVKRGASPRWQLTDRPHGKTRTLYVPLDRVEEVRRWTAEWKKARQWLRNLSEATREELRAGAGRADGAPPPRRTTRASPRG